MKRSVFCALVLALGLLTAGASYAASNGLVSCIVTDYPDEPGDDMETTAYFTSRPSNVYMVLSQQGGDSRTIQPADFENEGWVWEYEFEFIPPQSGAYTSTLYWSANGVQRSRELTFNTSGGNTAPQTPEGVSYQQQAAASGGNITTMARFSATALPDDGSVYMVLRGRDGASATPYQPVSARTEASVAAAGDAVYTFTFPPADGTSTLYWTAGGVQRSSSLNVTAADNNGGGGGGGGGCSTGLGLGAAAALLCLPLIRRKR